ncbi:LPS assembly lipoprotein LptE [uncultured Rhodospira sp.]|uniref:LPS assembly lipoprotein LptE n=1 Tax=uncultured Rhodospira sp. TaxID=1936189 RepID=UPI00262E13FE|nr:LPS assembly lipoprotein LptE [uncultured Rhodospira sp.]
MSPRWPAISRRLVATAPLLALAACGFRPLYGRRGRGGPALSSIAVEPIPERMGQLLRNALLDRLQPAGQTRHVLQAQVTLVDQDLGIQSNDRATLGNLYATVTWRLLTPTGEGRRRLDLEETSRSAVTYNILDNQYATEQSRRAAQRAIADDLAATIETRLAAYFST